MFLLALVLFVLLGPAGGSAQTPDFDPTGVWVVDEKGDFLSEGVGFIFRGTVYKNSPWIISMRQGRPVVTIIDRELELSDLRLSGKRLYSANGGALPNVDITFSEDRFTGKLNVDDTTWWTLDGRLPGIEADRRAQVSRLDAQLREMRRANASAEAGRARAVDERHRLESVLASSRDRIEQSTAQVDQLRRRVAELEAAQAASAGVLAKAKDEARRQLQALRRDLVEERVSAEQTAAANRRLTAEIAGLKAEISSLERKKAPPADGPRPRDGREPRGDDVAGGLIAAIRSKDHDRLRAILGDGGPANVRDVNGVSPLHWAIQVGDARSARLLIDKGADPNARDSRGVTPLYAAAYHGHAEIARVLIAGGADANARTILGRTPLHAAAYYGRLDVGRILVAARTDPAAVDKHGVSAIALASRRGHQPFVDLLRGTTAQDR